MGSVESPKMSITLGDTHTLCPVAWVRAAAHRCHERAVLSRPRQRALGRGRRSPGKQARPVCHGPWLAQECGRLVAPGGSRGDAEPGCPHSRSRHPRSRTMFLPFLLLLATAHGLYQVQYTPTLANSSLMGQITNSTFVLNQPRCAFPSLENDTNIIIWLVVATPEAAANFNDSLGSGNPTGAYQTFPSPTRAYMTLGTSILQYPCQKPPRDITVLRVGSETSCANNSARPNCNGPLPGPGPYRVKFLAFNRSEPVAGTGWSDPITLKQAKPYINIPTTYSRHSGGMIAITTILSILLAVLLAGLVAMLIFGSSDSCSGSSTFTKPEMVTVRKYNTHHVYDQPAARL